MRRVVHCSAAVLLLVSATAVFAGGYDYSKEDLSGYNLQPNFKVDDESDYSRNGRDLYLFGGGLFTYRFLSDDSQTVTSPSGSRSYVPKNVMPDDFYGIELGFGKELSRHFDAQVAYLQNFSKTKDSRVSGNTSMTVKMNGIAADVGYVFNPDSQFQVMAKFGTLLSDFHQSITIDNVSYYPTLDSTKIDPLLGLDFITQFTQRVALRIGVTYAFSTYREASNGQADAFAGLSYIL